MGMYDHYDEWHYSSLGTVCQILDQINLFRGYCNKMHSINTEIALNLMNFSIQYSGFPTIK